MPSPLLHSAAGLVLARFMRDGTPDRRVSIVSLAALVVAANAADLDFIPGIVLGDPTRFHHAASHSLLAAGAFAAAGILVGRWLKCRSPLRFGLLLGLAFAIHLALDMFASAVDERHGVALAWPFMSHHFWFPYPIFVGISLDPTAGNFFLATLHRRNMYAVAWEWVVVGAVWGLARLAARVSR